MVDQNEFPLYFTWLSLLTSIGKKAMNSESEHLSKADPVLRKIIGTVPPPEIENTNNVFHDLMSCVLEQQIHYRSTKKIFQKMLDRAGLTVLTPDNFSDFEENAFDGIKLSAKKYETALNIVKHWEENDVNWTELSDEEITNELSSIKGIGQWTIDMVLIYTLKRPDAFPYDDFHIKQIMVSIYSLNPQSKLKAQMLEASKAWRPYRSMAFLYLLEWKNLINRKQ